MLPISASPNRREEKSPTLVFLSLLFLPEGLRFGIVYSQSFLKFPFLCMEERGKKLRHEKGEAGSMEAGICGIKD